MYKQLVRLPLFLSLFLLGCGGSSTTLLPTQVEVNQAQILQQQSIWNAGKLSDYRFVYSSVPRCDKADAFPSVTITVKKGQAVSATFPSYVEVKAGTPGAIAETISSPSGNSTKYYIVDLQETSGFRLTINDVFQTMLDLNQRQKISGIHFHEPLGSPQSFEGLGLRECDNFIVSLSAPEPL